MKYLTSAAAMSELVIADPVCWQTMASHPAQPPPTKLSNAPCEIVCARINIAKAHTVTATQAESALSTSNFKTADTNNDGMVSHAELLGGLQRGQGERHNRGGSRVPKGTDTDRPKKQIAAAISARCERSSPAGALPPAGLSIRHHSASAGGSAAVDRI